MSISEKQRLLDSFPDLLEVSARAFAGTGGINSGAGTTIPHSTNVIGTYTTKLKFWETLRDDLGGMVDLANSRLIIPNGYKECRLTYNLAFGLPAWSIGSTKVVGDTVIPTTYGTKQYVATSITTGITGATEPTWPTTDGNTVVDGGVTWTCRASGWATGWRGCRVKNSAGSNYGNQRISSCGDGTTTNVLVVTPWILIATSVAPNTIAAGDYFELYPTQTSGQPMVAGADLASSYAQIEVR